MSVRFNRGGWEARWRDASGRHRARRFPSEEAARAFEAGLKELEPANRRGSSERTGGGVYSYETASGPRWRYVARRSDGTQTSKRGFSSRKAASDARRRLVEQVERGEVRHTRETFEQYWTRYLTRRKPYLEPGTWRDYDVHGRKRLLPTLAEVQLGRLSVEHVRTMMDELAEAVDEGVLKPKTVNNTLGVLVTSLNAAVEDGLMAHNPAIRVPRLPLGHVERDYLRLAEIPRYLEACPSVYRPLAEVLIGAGLRISEALGLRIADLKLERGGGVITVYRSRKGDGVGSTKSDRFRAVEIGPQLTRTLRAHVAHLAPSSKGPPDDYLFVMPIRELKSQHGRWGSSDMAGEVIDRNTVSRNWHKDVLSDAGLRDMPLHALRHTAAAAWLAAGNTLAYVQQQLGHADIATTMRYYGHLERRALAAGALATETAIAEAVASETATAGGTA